MSSKAQNIIAWLTAFLTALGIFLGILCGRGIYNLYGFIDPCLFPGVILVLIGGLLVVTHMGAFDIFNFGFRSIFSHMNPDPNHVEKYSDYNQFVQDKRRQRQYSSSYSLPFFIIGGCFLIAGIIIDIIFNLSLA